MQRYILVLALTLLYWVWESQAEGNIRIDLLLLYPLLLASYVLLLWSKLRWWSVAVAFLLMGANYLFFSVSYELFDKHPG